MEELDCLWDYQESILEVKHKILCTSFELESARTEAREERIKFDENIKQVLQLLQTICQERDEAKDQLQRLLNKVDSIDSSPVDCHFTANSSPDLFNLSLIDPIKVREQNCSSISTCMIDPDLAVIDNLVKGRPLPHKGRLLQTVIEAGPLLQTLLVARPLPRWHSPPFQKIEANSNRAILNSLCSSYHNICHRSCQRPSPLTLNLDRGSDLWVEHRE